MYYYRVQISNEPLPTRSVSWDGEDSRAGLSVCTSWHALIAYFRTRSTREQLARADIVICGGSLADDRDMDARGEHADTIALLDPATVQVLRRRPLSRHEVRALLGRGGDNHGASHAC